jgi:ankyrin repeat protein
MQQLQKPEKGRQDKPRLDKHKPAAEEFPFFKRTQRELNKCLFEKVGYGWIEDVRSLLDQGANPDARDDQFGMTALTKAAVQGHFAICKLLIERGADVNAKSKKGKATALMCAAHNNHSYTCLLLVENGANVNAKDKDGWTPLMHAGAQGHTDICDFLIRHGADVNVADKKGWTAYIIARSHERFDTATFLTRMGLVQQAVGRRNLAPFLREFRACTGGA